MAKTLFESVIPDVLSPLAKEIRGRNYETAKRIIVSKVGSVKRGERFADDVADAVFARLQRNAQVGRYASEDELHSLGRDAERLTGDGTITLYRAAPKGAGIRPGDFATSDPREAGFYTHGGHTLHSITVPRSEVFSIAGSMGGGPEYVYLPQGYTAPEAQEYFHSFREFYDAVNGAAMLESVSPLVVRTPDDIDPNTKVVLPVVYRGVERGPTAVQAIRIFKGGDLGDGVYVTADKKLAQTYGGGWRASIKNGMRVVYAYTVDPLFPEDAAYLFGGLRDADPAYLVTGNGIEIYRGEWSGPHLEAALRDTGIKLVIGTPGSVGVNQIAVREPSLLQPVPRRTGRTDLG